MQNQWPVHILQHPNEARHAIGTARIAELSLSDCRIETGSHVDESASAALVERQALLVYPSEDATPLTDFVASAPVPLVFLDASWKKSRRMLYESPQLQQLQSVSLTGIPPSRYLIRKEPGPGYVSTLEAIVFALSLLEDDASKYQSLLATMDYMIQRQIDYMGKAVFEKNYPG